MPRYDDDTPEIDFDKAPEIIKKPANFLKNYWYYYRMPVTFIGIFVLVIIGVIIGVATNKKVDYTVPIASGLVNEDDQNKAMIENLKSYLPDITGDGKLDISSNILYFTEQQTSDEYTANQFDALTVSLVNDEICFYIADEYSMSYLIKVKAVEPFSVLGVGADDEYAVELTDTDILKGTTLSEHGKYYLLAKIQTETSLNNEDYLARREGLKKLITALKDR